MVIGWSGIPGSYPIVSYTLQESIDGGSETTVATGPATTYTLTANPGSTYSFQAQATDSNGDTGPFTAGPAFSLSEHQQSFATCQGSWSPRRRLAGSWGGTVAATTTAVTNGRRLIVTRRTTPLERSAIITEYRRPGMHS